MSDQAKYGGERMQNRLTEKRQRRGGVRERRESVCMAHKRHKKGEQDTEEETECQKEKNEGRENERMRKGERRSMREGGNERKTK